MADVTAKTPKEVHQDNGRKVKVRGPDGEVYERLLPPITQIVIPHTTTKSATIRWLGRLGYSVKEIYPFLGVKYQMVRNILTTEPKRAAREDTPDLIVEYKPETDVINDAMDGALEASLMEGRRERLKANKAGFNEEEEE
jgi:hypothetical protein